MNLIDLGRICVKLTGREAGKKCVIVDFLDDNYVTITGPKKITGVRRRRVNINHLLLLKDKINIQRAASDEEVISALKGKKGYG